MSNHELVVLLVNIWIRHVGSQCMAIWSLCKLLLAQGQTEQPSGLKIAGSTLDQFFYSKLWPTKASLRLGQLR